MPQTSLQIEGMTCSACSNRIEKVLNRKGVVTKVNLATERASIEILPESELKTNEDVIHAIEKLGYGAKLEQKKEVATNRKVSIVFWFSLILTAPFLVQMIGMLIPSSHLHLPGWLQIALATPVQIVAGYRFYRGAYHSLLSGIAGMDVLVSLGTSVAYLYSLYLFSTGASGHELYFEASAMILTLVLAGKEMERKAKSHTADAIRKLMNLAPITAIVLRNEQQVEVPVESIQENEQVLIKPGGRIPVDGIIVSGESAIDESMITGESNPVERNKGDKVMAGTLNTDRSIVIKATAIGENTILSEIIRMVEEAQGSKAEIQNLADKISSIFVPSIVLISILTFLWWWLTGAGLQVAILHAVAVLVISCPCALGLATPTALMVGTGLAARNGILIRNAEAIDRAGKIQHIVFDKTGTLTQGMGQIESIETVSQLSESEALSIAASIESHSEHPLAKAFVRAAADRELQTRSVESIQLIEAAGITGQIDNTEFIVASPEYLKKHAIGLDALNRIEEFRSAGSTVSVLANMKTNTIEAIFEIKDPIKEEAIEAINRIQKNGIEVTLLTGDHERVARSIAGQLSIQSVFAEVKPGDKREQIMKLKESQTVAMVGDGINDAPALAEADVSFAMGSGADVSLEVADITLMKKNLMSVSDAIELSRATLRKIKQNLFFAFVYNSLGIPLAAAGYLSPVIAGAAMALSSVSVVTSSLMLKNWRPTK